MLGSRRRRSALAAAVALAALGTACIRFGRSPDPPEALRRYLEALVEGDHRTAYDVTQLEKISRAPGAGLTFEHFRAFWTATPLTGYAVTRSTKLNRIDMARPAEPGTPFFDVDVELRYRGGPRKQNFGVEGEVLGTVTVDPAPVRLRTPGRRPRLVLIDGIPTPLPPSALRVASTYSLLVLPGSHTLEIEGLEPVAFDTEPLRVRAGPARVDDSGRALVVGE